VAGCQSNGPDGRASPRSPTTDLDQQATPTAPESVDVLVTTDGTSVTARGPEGVIAEGGDAGSVMQSVLETVPPRPESAGEPFPDDVPVPGRHVHFGRGSFPWTSQAVSTGANGLRITGQWYGTDWSAESSIESFLHFGNPDDFQGSHVGPKIAYLQYHGNDNARYFVSLDTATDDAEIGHVFGHRTKEAMVYGKPTGQGFVDNVSLHHLHVVFGGAIAIFEDGPGGIPADIKIEKCACNFPNTYAVVLRNPQRVQVDRVYGGLNFIDDSKGVVLIENPVPEFDNRPDTMQCQLNMIELEDGRGDFAATEPKDGVAVHIRSPDDAVTYNRIHQVRFPRARQLGHERFLTVDGRVAGGEYLTRDVTLEGIQLPPAHDRAIELTDAADCHVDVTVGADSTRELPGRFEDRTPLSPREAVSIENGRRNTVNGVGVNPGNPAATGPWNGAALEGATVLDDENDDLYRYVDGRWWRFGQAV
jgi:hypothetical protein